MKRLAFHTCHAALWLILAICQNAFAQSSTPVVSSVSPSKIAAGSGSTQVAISGSGFTNGIVVRLNSQSLITSFVSSTELDALIPNINLGTPAILQLNVSTGSTSSGSVNVSVYSSALPATSSVSPSVVAAHTTVAMTFAGS